MQTFLPYADFSQSAAVLDYRRIGKQRVETYQILRALRGESSGWANHPATKMWRGFEASLVEYGIAICDEWVSRGYRDTLRDKFAVMSADYRAAFEPDWLGDPALHASHQSNLYRKDPDFYSLFAPVGGDLLYVWPVA